MISGGTFLIEISSISILNIRQCFENSKELSNGCDDKGKKHIRDYN